MPKGFSVDTHIFRELGELLVGRDSTALIELIKNAYDADATFVRVEGHRLRDPDAGRIVVEDNGTGMTSEVFELGFLRIASRTKEAGERRSAKYHRRFTGAKGVGRLAAHKLGRFLRVITVPDADVYSNADSLVTAEIDWTAIEECETLDQVAARGAVIVEATQLDPTSAARRTPGTQIDICRFRRPWSDLERARFFWEVETFRPPTHLLEDVKHECAEPPLLSSIRVNDSAGDDPGFAVELHGDFEVGEEYWSALVTAATWMIEIDATAEGVGFQITPTKRTLEDIPDATSLRASMPHPDVQNGPFFQTRILIREGRLGGKRAERAWLGRHTGVRIYMEGFRVLPYGERGDDWLELDLDYALRTRSLRFLEMFADDIVQTTEVPDGADDSLVGLKNQAYFGAVFLTSRGAPSLQMVVNREGFIPSAAFDHLKHLVRLGIDLSVRHRASVRSPERAAWREKRSGRALGGEGADAEGPSGRSLSSIVKHTVAVATELASQAKDVAASGDFERATELIVQASAHFQQGAEAHDRLMSEATLTRILAGIGLQMTAFVHEMRSLMAMTRTLEELVSHLQADGASPLHVRNDLKVVSRSLGELRRIVERQASYLTDIASPDARRRRSRQNLRDRVDTAVRFLSAESSEQSVVIQNDLPQVLKTLPMFPSEMSIILINLLSNAIKAAGRDGSILATGREDGDVVRLRIENTGVEVRLDEAERWFLPFESTTTRAVAPALGQGMGMGLPIVRQLLEEYGGWVQFVPPSDGYQSAVEVTLPRRRA